MSRTRSTALAAGAAGAPRPPGRTPASAADTATVSILHAVPGTPVDVYANGEELIPDFQPGTLTDPMELPAGTYDLAIYPAGVRPGHDRSRRVGRGRRTSRPAPTPPSWPTSTADGKPVLTPVRQRHVRRSRPGRRGSPSGTPPPRPPSTCGPAAPSSSRA